MPRKQKIYHYIYKTICLITKRYYIGMHSTNDLEDGYLGSGKRLRNSIRKYSKENHIKEILEYLPNRKLLIEREFEIVNNELIQDELCMNLMCGGTGGYISKENQIKRSIAGNKKHLEKLKNDEKYKKDFCNKVKNGILKYLLTHKNSMCGKKHSIESKTKMSNSHIGQKNSQFGTCWITKNKINKKIKKNDLQIYLNDGWILGRFVK